MSTRVEVIVSPTRNDHICGARLQDLAYQDLESAYKVGAYCVEHYADSKIEVVVIVRPVYNEHDESGRFFREWRSFNGEPFKEVRWTIDW